MSMSVPYTPPDYVPPEALASQWVGAERRSADPVNQLGRSLNQLCVEAADHFEIVAHLEALGYNSATALKRFGHDDHFQLAEELFNRVPRRSQPRSLRAQHQIDALSPLSMAITFIVTFALGSLSNSQMLVPAIWVLIWSQLGATLLAKGHGELPDGGGPKLLSLVMVCGLLGVAATWGAFRFGLDILTPLLLWYAVAGLLWRGRKWQAVILPLLSGASIAAGVAFGWPSHLPLLVTLGLIAAAALPLMLAPFWRLLPWLARSMPALLFPALYGLGQGLLIVALLAQSAPGSNVVPGAALLVAILLSSQRLLLLLKGQLTRRLWQQTSSGAYQQHAQQAVIGYATVYLLPLVAVVLVGAFTGPLAWFFHWYAFALFGLCLGLAVVSFTLGDAAAPGYAFATAGLAALLGAPFLMTCAVLAAVQLLLVLIRSRHAERYAIYLL